MNPTHDITPAGWSDQPRGCRTLCQYPGCARPIEAGPKGWHHVDDLPDAQPWHPATPVELNEQQRIDAAVVAERRRMNALIEAHQARHDREQQEQRGRFVRDHQLLLRLAEKLGELLPADGRRKTVPTAELRALLDAAKDECPPGADPVRVPCTGLGCRAPAWRMSNGDVWCSEIEGIVPPEHAPAPADPTRPLPCGDCREACPQDGAHPCTEDGCGCSCRREAERARPVQALHIIQMATRAAHACQDMVAKTQHPGQDSPMFQRALRTYLRRMEALRRLANALERQGGGVR